MVKDPQVKAEGAEPGVGEPGQPDKLPTNSVIIPPSRTRLSVTAKCRSPAPGGAGASWWPGGGAEPACTIIGLGCSCGQLDPAASDSTDVLAEERRRPKWRYTPLKASGGWRGFDDLVSSATLRSFPDNLPQAREAQRRSRVVASFGHGTQRVEIRKVRGSPL